MKAASIERLRLIEARGQRLTGDRGVSDDFRGTRVALQVVVKVRRRLDLVARNPGIGHTREDLTSRNLRFCTEFSYLILYSPTKPVRIVRVLHGNRDLRSILKPDRPRQTGRNS